jgi:hypothetical protein
VEFADERRAVAFEKYLKSGSGFAARSGSGIKLCRIARGASR